MNFTRAAVLVFIIVLLLAAANAWSADGPKIALGHSMINSHVTIAEIGYEKSNWEANLTILGEGETKKGNQEPINVYSLSKLVRPDWCFLGGCNYYRLGIARVNDSALVGPWNYRLGVGMDWRIFSLEYFHYSSAGTYATNTGVDGILLKLNIPLE